MANPLDAFVSERVPATSDLRIPPLPKLDDLTRRMGFKEGTKEYDKAMEEWRQGVERLIRRLQGLIQAEAVPAPAPDVPTPTPPVVPPVTPPNNGAIQAVLDQLLAHIAATIVHGTESDVSGVTDEETLERKTIGVNFPRDGYFRHMLQANEVSVGEDFTVPTDKNMLVAGPFSIFGTLTVEGNFAVV